MSVSTALHTQLAAVMESLVHAAVAELKKLMEGSSPLLLGMELQCRSSTQEPPLVDKVQVDSGEAMVRGWVGCSRFEVKLSMSVQCTVVQWVCRPQQRLKNAVFFNHINVP